MRQKEGILSPPGSHQLQPYSGASCVLLEPGTGRGRKSWFLTSKTPSTGERNPGGQLEEAACTGSGAAQEPPHPRLESSVGRSHRQRPSPLLPPVPRGQVFMEALHLSDCTQPGAGKMRPQEALMQKIIAHRDTLPVDPSQEAHGEDGPREASCSPGEASEPSLGRRAGTQ